MTIDLVAWLANRVAAESARADETMARSDEFFSRYLAASSTGSDLDRYWLGMSLREQSRANEAHARRTQYEKILSNIRSRMQ